MKRSDGTRAQDLIKAGKLGTAEVDLLTGAVAAACELCAEEAVRQDSEHEGQIIQAILQAAPQIVESAFDRGIVSALLPAIEPDGEGPSREPDPWNAIAVAVNRAAAKYRDLAQSIDSAAEDENEIIVLAAKAMRGAGHHALPQLELALRQARRAGLDVDAICSAWEARERYAPTHVGSKQDRKLLRRFDEILHDVSNPRGEA